MSSPVRRIQAFYEATGPYAVNKAVAESIYKATFAIISQHVGMVALEGPRTASIALGDRPISLADARLGSAAHTMLLTGRAIDEGELRPGESNAGLCDVYTLDKVVKMSSTVVQVKPALNDPTASRALYTGVHEAAHSFGLDHCKAKQCIMQSYAVYDELQPSIQPLVTDNPFCDNCASNLELAGHVELAVSLV